MFGFGCKKCKSLENEIAFLREQQRGLLDRLMALADAKAFGAVQLPPADSPEYYGGGDDEMIEYEPETGRRVIVKADQ